MSENPFPFLSDDWLKLQEKYWKSWTDLAAFKPGSQAFTQGADLPWNKAMDQWWQAVSPSVPGTSKGFFDQLVNQGKSCFRLSESLLSMLQEASACAGTTDDWRHSLEKWFHDMKSAVGKSASGDPETLSQMMAFWELPMDTWQRTLSVLSGTPGDWLQPFKSVTAHQQMAPVREQLNRFLSVPGVGYTREHQEQYQTLFQLFLDYQAALEAYAVEYSKIAVSSIEQFQSKVMGLVERGETIDSMKALFDLWVDASEEAYGERVLSEEYAQNHGRLVNALMAYKRQGQALVDDSLGLLNMPTREDVETLQEQLHRLRRELRKFETEMRSPPQQATAPPATPPGQNTRPRAKKRPSATASARSRTTKKTSARRSPPATTAEPKKEDNE